MILVVAWLVLLMVLVATTVVSAFDLYVQIHQFLVPIRDCILRRHWRWITAQIVLMLFQVWAAVLVCRWFWECHPSWPVRAVVGLSLAWIVVVSQIPIWHHGFLIYGSFLSTWYELRLEWGGLTNLKESLLYIGDDQAPWAIRYEFDMPADIPVSGVPALWMKTRMRPGKTHDGFVFTCPEKLELSAGEFECQNGHCVLVLCAPYWLFRGAFADTGVHRDGGPGGSRRVCFEGNSFRLTAERVQLTEEILHGGRLFAEWTGWVKGGKNPPLKLNFGPALARLLNRNSRLSGDGALLKEVLLVASDENLGRLGLIRCAPVRGGQLELICYADPHSRARQGGGS